MVASSISLAGRRIQVRTTYSPGLAAALKTSIDPRRKWEPETKCWTYPAEPDPLKKVVDLLGLDPASLSDDLRSLLAASCVRATREISDEEIAVADHLWRANSATCPYAHQVRGVAELAANPRWLLAWEQGTGKSAVVSVRLAQLAKSGLTGPVLIVGPKSATWVWPTELKRHAGLQCHVLAGTPAKRKRIIESIGPGDILVANYELVCRDRELLEARKFAVVVADESHRVKSPQIRTSKALRSVARHAKNRWALSGTPSPNGPLDICGTLIFLDEEILGTSSITAIRARYAMIGPLGSWHVVGYKNLDDLRSRTAAVSSRVTKAEALDLPERVFVDRLCEMTGEQKRVYNEVRTKAVAKLAEGGRLTAANVLTELIRLMQISGGFVPDDDGKICRFDKNAKLDLLRDILDDLPPGEPLIVWCAFVEEVEAICKLLGGSAWRHHGGVADADRKAAIHGFQAGGRRAFVSTMASARECLNLTRATTCIYYSRNYSLLDWSQSLDRCHRIGSTKKVTVYYLMAENTVDVKVAKALEGKVSMQEMILRGNVEEIL